MSQTVIIDTYKRPGLPANLGVAWQALFAAVQRQESTWSRIASRLVKQDDLRRMRAFLRDYWNALYSNVTTTGPAINTSGSADVRATMTYVMATIVAFMRARTAAAQLGLPLADFGSEDTAWIELVNTVAPNAIASR